MRKWVAIALAISMLPLASACGASGAANSTSGSAKTALSYLPNTGNKYTYSDGKRTFSETYTKGTPDLSQVPDDAKWLQSLKGTWLQDTDADETGNSPKTYVNWIFDNGTYDVMADGTFHAVSTLLEYPIAQNKTWQNTVGDGVQVQHVIVGVDLQVTTPAGTFNHVLEVKRTYTTGYTVDDYMAPNIGSIKMVGSMPNEPQQTTVLTSIQKIG